MPHRALLLKQTYTQRVLATRRSSLIGYWQLNDPSGTVARDSSGNERHGTYNGVTLGQQGSTGDASTAPLFDGVNDYCTIYSASFAAAFNGLEGALMGRIRVSAAGIWTDAATRRAAYIAVNSSNRCSIYRSTINNSLEFLYIAGGTNKTVVAGSQSSTGWLHVAMTWSKVTDQMKAYVNGAQVGATQTALGTFAGALDSTTTMIGATTTALGHWSGLLDHVALWNIPLSTDEVAHLARIP